MERAFNSPVRSSDQESKEISIIDKDVPVAVREFQDGRISSTKASETGAAEENAGRPEPSLKWKVVAILLVSAIGFGSRWSSGITGAMKSTLKKELHINNTQFALLEASEDFMVTALILLSGLLTDRIGGAGAILYGNAIYSVGSILIAAAAQVRSYRFMIAGRIVAALGDIATQIAQYKIFSSWFPPNSGFASTLGLELGIGKIGSFVGKSSANIIAKNTGDFAWVFWVAVFMNLFTNFVTIVFYRFNKIATKRFAAVSDPATGEKLTEKNKKFELKKVLELPWIFWCIMIFSFFQTSTAIVFTQNATELAEQRFGTDAITAGWYSATLQYAGFFLVPLIGIFIDLYGNRVSLMVICGTGTFLAMTLIAYSQTTSGNAAAFGIFAFAFTFGPTVIIDGIRTSMWHQSVFGSAYAIKIAMNNSVNIIVRVATGVIQDRDNNSYDNVSIFYSAWAAAAAVVSILLVVGSMKSVDLRRLQWTRKQRIAKGAFINERKSRFYNEEGEKNKKVSKICFGSLIVLILGAWAAYFWGVATGNN